MIGIVIVAHGGLAREYLAAVEHVVGKQTAIRTISIGPDDDRSAKRLLLMSTFAARGPESTSMRAPCRLVAMWRQHCSRVPNSSVRYRLQRET